jgi:PAS domain S-box-containing protein
MDQQSKRSLIDPNRIYPSEAERQAAVRAFAEESGPFRTVFEYAAIGMAIVDLDGRFLKVNPALLQIVGYDEHELLATDFQSITHPDDLDSDVELARKIMVGEIEYYHMEKRYLHKRGHVVWVQLSVSAARDDAGRVTFTIAQIQDITSRKMAELEAARRLRHIDRLTHAVRSVLHVIDRRPNKDLYPGVLQVVMHAFNSPSGVFLRDIGGDRLVGPFITPSESRDMQCSLSRCCELWREALLNGTAMTETRDRVLNCGATVARSLLAPILFDGRPLGVFHLGNAKRGYDDDDRDLLMRVGAIIAPAIHVRMQRDKLTPREAEVMDLIVQGMSQKQIATTLNVSVQTTAKHRARVLEKLNLHSDVELVRLALQIHPGWAENDGTMTTAPAESIPKNGHPGDHQSQTS